jgi:PAS domain S-box-containing protein
MSSKKPTYQELKAKLAEAEKTIAALRREEVDAVVGNQHVALLRLREAEEALIKSEHEKTVILDTMSEHVVYRDTKMRVLWANKAAGESVGLAPEQLVGRHCYEIWHQRSKACVVCPAKETLKTSQEEEMEITTPDGRIWRIRTYPIRDANGEIVGIANVTLEITERKRDEQEREQLLADLELKNRELESFTYTVSHDLKGPLVSLSGFSSALQKELHDQLSEQGRHYLERIQANVDHMDTLITDLLELSRIGQVVGPREEIDTAVLVRDIQEELAVKLEQVGAEFVVKGPLPAVHADRERIRQVFANLIDNSLKFRIEDRPLRIEVGCQKQEGFYRFHVTDNGIGITHQYHEKMFAPFQQLDPKAEGMGIGLALVKKIVEHHGGRTWVESKEAQGASFYFTLPTEPPR